MSTILVFGSSKPDYYHALSFDDVQTEFIPLAYSSHICEWKDYDLVVVDCDQDASSALLLLKLIKECRPDVPVIFVAGTSTDEFVIKAFKEGVRDYFKKPAKTDVLSATVQLLLDLRRQTLGMRKAMHLARKDMKEERTPDIRSMPPNILRSIRLIESSFHAPLDLESLAREAFLSKFHFSRLFKSYLGMSPMKYVLMLRINHSLTLLKDSGLTISTVALRVGFNNLGEFTRQFRKIVGQLPSAYRKSHNQKIV